MGGHSPVSPTKLRPCCQDFCVKQTHAAKCFCRNLKWTFEDLLPCYCYATKANSRTIRSQVSQSAFARKGVDLVNCKAHHCMIPEQWTWLLCSVSVTPVNELPLHELNQLIEIKLLTSTFLEIFASSQLPGRG